MRVWTIGHSTRTIDEFISLLQANQIRLLIDVRLLPGSVTNIFQSLVAGERRIGIRITRLGVMRHFAATPITWRQMSSRKVFGDFSILPPTQGRLRSCARKQSG